MTDNKPYYCILYTQSLKQWEVTEAIQKALPDGTGEVFYPVVELWWRGAQTTRYRAMFPGYVFIRSKLGTTKLHELIRRQRRDILSFVRELHISEKRMGGENAFADDFSGGADGESSLVDLTDEEAEFFDCLLGFEYDDGYEERRKRAEEEGLLKPEPIPKPERPLTKREREAAAMEAELHRRRKRLPQRGVAQISFGYKEDGRYIVMEGPLRGNEHRIVDYRPRDQKAYLDVSLGGRAAKVGLIILGKKAWFPEDKDAPDILADGMEFRSENLLEMMSMNYFEKDKKERRTGQRRRSREERDR